MSTNMIATSLSTPRADGGGAGRVYPVVSRGSHVGNRYERAGGVGVPHGGVVSVRASRAL